jgi:hypothetical protein
VAVLLHVDEVHHRREGGGLPRARGPGHEDEAAGPHEEVLHARGEADVLEREELVRDLAEGDAHVALLHVDRDAEARLLLEREPEIGAALFLQLVLAALRGDGLHEPDGVVGCERGDVQGLEAAAHADRRRDAHRQVEIGRPLVDDEVQQLVEFNRHDASRDRYFLKFDG